MSEKCPTCGSAVRVVGRGTNHYEPVRAPPGAPELHAFDLLRYCERAIAIYQDYAAGNIEGGYEGYRAHLEYRVCEWCDEIAAPRNVGGG